MRYTKGKWEAVELLEKQDYCTHEIHFNEDGECITDGVYGEANAKLIAAAPELFEALQSFLEVTTLLRFPTEVELRICNKKAKEAIEKATGNQY